MLFNISQIATMKTIAEVVTSPRAANQNIPKPRSSAAWVRSSFTPRGADRTTTQYADYKLALTREIQFVPNF